MSKWTLDKIKNCKEIKFGTKIKYIGGKRKSLIFVRVQDDRLMAVSEDCDLTITSYTESTNLFKLGMEFYRPDGTIIEPPKDKKKVQRPLLMAKVDQPSGYGCDVVKGQLVVCQGKAFDHRLWQEVKLLDNGNIEVEVDD